MVMGRPKEYDREAIAKALVEWAIKDDSLNLNGFCTTHDPLIPPPYLSIWANEDEQFSKAYNLAKAFLAVRRERKLKEGELHVKAYDLNAAVYDFFLRDERRKEKEHEAGLKSSSVDQSIENLATLINKIEKGEIKQE